MTFHCDPVLAFWIQLNFSISITRTQNISYEAEHIQNAMPEKWLKDPIWIRNLHLYPTHRIFQLPPDLRRSSANFLFISHSLCANRASPLCALSQKHGLIDTKVLPWRLAQSKYFPAHGNLQIHILYRYFCDCNCWGILSGERTLAWNCRGNTD